MNGPLEPDQLRQLEAELGRVRRGMLAAERARASEIAATHPRYRRSAANLVHYLALRHHDVRDLQLRLGACGLSSLGRSEPHVLATIEAVLAVVARLLGHEPPPPPHAEVALDEGHLLLAANADRLLGRAPKHRATRIMVTLASEVADDPAFAARMLAAGLDVARVNCAHDGPEAWARMIEHVRAGGRARPCRVAMDLGGPKLRTGPLADGPCVLRIRPRRDALGEVTSMAEVWLTAVGAPPPHEWARCTAVAVDDGGWASRRRPGDKVRLRDARGRRRTWLVTDVGDGGCIAVAERSAYIVPGTRLRCSDDATTVVDVPPVEQSHDVGLGDRIELTRMLDPAPPAAKGEPHRIGCTLPEAFDSALPGERVWFDDGKIGGEILEVSPDVITIVVTDIGPGGRRLRAGKGINMPATALHIGALTEQDLADLDFVARHADLVNLSFVRTPADVERLRCELAQREAEHIGIVLKIETQAAFENLPELLLSAMRSPDVGVMIARGDLAVEVGFERMAEVQEEILWACEAAHVPVIWATQVLDTLARTGQPSRAEVTDAAMSERAECVMLNKGPYIVEAIAALDSILARMQSHQHKKRSLLRRLRAWDHAPAGA